jgi:c(7)-type cytochrome triheme protein
MRSLIALFVLSVGTLGVLAQQKKPPHTLVFEAKTGNVTFDHAAHLKRANGDCKVCHDALWPQEKVPLNFKPAIHKTAEANHTSCGFCHAPGGKSFETKGNCMKCHVKAAAKQG